MKHKITIIGLGYVGLPLARLFSTKFPVVGFDINEKRIQELNSGKDETLEIEENLLKSALVSSNPQTGETIKIAASTAPAFKAGKAFKEAVNKKKHK